MALITTTDFPPFECGSKFSSYAEFEAAKELYQNKNFVVLVKTKSEKFHDCHKHRERLVYKTVVFECKKGHNRKPSTSKGIRPNVKTGKLGCHFKLKLSCNNGILVVKESNLQHNNHQLSEESFLHLPEKLRLNKEEIKQVELALKSGGDYKKIQIHLMEQRGGKPVLLKSLHNISTRMKQKVENAGLTGDVQQTLDSGESIPDAIINVAHEETDASTSVEQDHHAILMVEKIPVKYGNSDSVEKEIRTSLTDFASSYVCMEYEESKGVALPNIEDGSFVFKKRPVIIKATETSCSCGFFTSMGLPCRHIMVVRREKNLPIYESSLCRLRWTRPYYRSAHPASKKPECDRYSEASKVTKSINSMLSTFPNDKYEYYLEKLKEFQNLLSSDKLIIVSEHSSDSNELMAEQPTTSSQSSNDVGKTQDADEEEPMQTINCEIPLIKLTRPVKKQGNAKGCRKTVFGLERGKKRKKPQSRSK